jgi:hypothetical protein
MADLPVPPQCLENSLVLGKAGWDGVELVGFSVFAAFFASSVRGGEPFLDFR